MNKYILRLAGGVLLSNWTVEYSDMDMRGVRHFCEGQFRMFPNIDEIQVFEHEEPKRYLGSFKAKRTIDWIEAKQ